MEAAKQEKCLFFVRGWKTLECVISRIKEKCANMVKNTTKIATDDPKRVIHSLKMALALTFVSLFYYIRPLYDGFGVAGMWAVLTVVLVFEFSVGATISKALNNGFATLMAAALGVGATHLAILFGKKGEPIVLGFLVFLLAAMSTFTMFVPSIKKRYDFGVLIFILTFSFVAVSGYRFDMILDMAYQRFFTTLIGGAFCIIVSIFVCPVWAGNDLHALIPNNIQSLATFLEGFGEEYFKVGENEIGNMNPKINDGKSFLQSHKSVLGSKNIEESLANFARWEPCHGRFRLHHPWKHYVKIGALTRQCAYQIETLSGYINSQSKTPEEFRRRIRDSCTKMSLESSKALRTLASSIETMTYPNVGDFHMESSKHATKELGSVLQTLSLCTSGDFFGIVPNATVTSILVNITYSVQNISESVHELAKLAHFKAMDTTISLDTKGGVALLHRGIVNPVLDDDESGEVGHVAIEIRDQNFCTKGEVKLVKCAIVNNIVSLSPTTN